MQITCPDCSNSIEIPENTEIGDVLVCANCGVELEVTSTTPVTLDYLLAQK